MRSILLCAGLVLLGCSSEQAPPGSGADENPPSVTLTSPGNNATLSGVVTVTATASDDHGIAGVTFMIDSVPLGAEDTEAPYTFSWNTLQGENATHHIAAGARDFEGNGTTSSPVTVTVVNPTTGSVRLVVSTEGADFDADGYIMMIGSRAVPVTPNQSVVVPDLPRGNALVHITGVAGNCTVVGYAEVATIINLEGVPSVTYRVRCSSLTAPAERIVWRHLSPGDAPDGALLSVNGNGTDRQLFLASYERDPEWSGDRSLVFYRSDRAQLPGLYSYKPGEGLETPLVLGAGLSDITGSPLYGFSAFVSLDNQVLVSFGTAGTNFLGIGNKPAWAPSADSILFVRDGDVWISSPLAVNMRRLVTGASSPRWSPNGSQILFWRDQGGGIGSYWIANADGTGATMVIQGSFLPDAGASWSPNGRQFVYSSTAGGQSNLWVVNTDGTGAVNITNGTGESNTQPTWFR